MCVPRLPLAPGPLLAGVHQVPGSHSLSGLHRLYLTKSCSQNHPFLEFNGTFDMINYLPALVGSPG